MTIETDEEISKFIEELYSVGFQEVDVDSRTAVIALGSCIHMRYFGRGPERVDIIFYSLSSVEEPRVPCVTLYGSPHPGIITSGLVNVKQALSLR